MSVVYTAEEQKTLNSLTQNTQFFSTLHELLVKGQFPGAAAPVLIDVFAQLEKLIKDNESKVSQINQQATLREKEEFSKDLKVSSK